ncbi:MAG TPA: cation diffusion facilitator family transporter [Elusimicrobiota bacterium]|nr:cation diffusion facilitator family transporter [Elusimicrobiota bacterium]
MNCPEAEPRPRNSPKSLFAALALNGLVSAAELGGGLWLGSLALVADAAHNAVDCAAIGLGIFAHFLSLKPPDLKRTFGYRRAEVLAALANGLGLLAVAGVVLRASYFGFKAPHPRPILPMPMLAFACVGLFANGASGLYVFWSGRANINTRAIFLHLFADALSSLAAIAAALIIWRTGWQKADAAASAVICAVIAASALSIIADTVHILMEGAPAHLDLDEIRRELSSLSGVSEVHDLHLWSLTEGSEALSGHLVVAPGRDAEAVLDAGEALLAERFGISHITLQIEKEKAP